MKFSPVSLLAAASIGAAGGLLFSQGGIGALTSLWDKPVHSVSAPAGQIETIFIALDSSEMPVPVERAGSGGALATFESSLLLLTHEGKFFDVTGDTGEMLNVVAPASGWDAMLKFEADNPSYDFAHYYFRYNDVDVRDGSIIVSFTKWEEAGSCYRNALAKASTNGARTAAELSISESDWEVFFASEPCLEPKNPGRALDGHMAGGRFRIDDAGDVILASGDYAFDGTYSAFALSQDPDNQYGKVLRISPDTGEVQTISQGHSNAQGLAIYNDEIYIVEHGRRGGDELNHIQEGLDYGWPSVSLGTRYNRLPLRGVEDYGRHPDFERPIFSWLPSVATSSLTTIDNFHPAWDGDLLAGSLSGQSLFRIRMHEGRVLFNEHIPVGKRIRYVHQFEDQIVLWTDSREVVKLTVGTFDASAQFAYAKVNDLDLTSEQKERTQVVMDQCAECHNFGVVASAAAPALGPVFGEAIASGNYDYSDALRATSGNWTRDALTTYLTAPEDFAPGTSMPNPSIDDPEIINALVDILEALQFQPE